MLLKAELIVLVFCIFFLLLGIEESRIKSADFKRDQALQTVKVLSQAIAQQNNAIKQMKDESNQQLSKIALAEKEAQKELDNYNKESQNVMDKKVPTQCDEAMKWGAQQGAEVYRCWIVDCKS